MLVDADDPQTWPPAVTDAVTAWIPRVRRPVRRLEHLTMGAAAERRFHALLDGHSLLAYHATRLTDEEVRSVRRDGLKQLTPRLIEQRVTAAMRAGLLDQRLRDSILRGHVFATSRADDRRDQVCFFAPRAVLDTNLDFALARMLAYWGGEAVHWGLTDTPLLACLETIGQPTVIAAAVRVDHGLGPLQVSPALLPVFVGRLLDVRGARATLFYRGAVPASSLLDVWQPGHPAYEAHRRLPRSPSPRHGDEIRGGVS